MLDGVYLALTQSLKCVYGDNCLYEVCMVITVYMKYNHVYEVFMSVLDGVCV